MGRKIGSKNTSHIKARSYSTFAVDSKTAEQFRDVASKRGYRFNRAVELALRMFMNNYERITVTPGVLDDTNQGSGAG